MSLLKCEMCGEEQPITRFKSLEVGRICEQCMTGTRTKRADEAIKERAMVVAKELSSLSAPELLEDVPKLKGILASVYRDFGGPGGFASHFYWVLMEMSKRKPVPSSVASLMLSFMKLHHQMEQTDEMVTAREMTDDQLRRETELATIKMIVDSAGDPEKRKMLDHVLGSHGYKIEEAETSEITEATSRAIGFEMSDDELANELKSFMEEDDG